MELPSDKKVCADTCTQRGLTLIGVIVATFILVSTTLAIVGLMSRTEHVIGGSLEKFTAVNLAREGIELVQAQRDTNWLSPNPNAEPAPWTDQLCDTSYRQSQCLTIDYDEGADSIQIQNNPSCQPQPLYRTDEGLWTHAAEPTRTPYSRLITIDCTKQVVTLEEAMQDIPATVGVTSTVTWQRGNTPESVVLKGRLYDWLQSSNSIGEGQCDVGNPRYAAFDLNNDGTVSAAEAASALQELTDSIAGGPCTVGPSCNVRYDVTEDGELTAQDLNILNGLRVACELI